MNVATTFRHLLRARNTLLWVVSGEERRVERAIASVAMNVGYAVRYWDCATGVSDVFGNGPDDDGNALQDEDEHGNKTKIEIASPNYPHCVFDALRRKNRSGREIWILRDVDPFIERDPTVERGLKSIARDLQDEIDTSKIAAVVVLSSSGEVPVSLRNSATVIDWPLPSREEVTKIVEDTATASNIKLNGDKEAIVTAASGLSAEDISNALSFSIASSGAIETASVAAQKKLIIDREPTLTWYEADERGMDAVGGLEGLKSWLSDREKAFTPQAREYGLPAPKGVFLLGVPGCGKSLSAKAIPAAWGVPLLRLDLGALKGSLVGQSEQNIRRALKVAEAVGRVVLWVDEIEKALAGASHSGDGGVAADALGTMLTWLQERAGEVFVVVTANDVSALPPELLRKGRFDGVFFVDLPTYSERQAIAETTLRKFSRDPEVFDLAAIARATDGFSGAEIAELVPDAMFRSFSEDREVNTADLIGEAASIVPMAKSAAEKIKALRDWSVGRARPASLPDEAASIARKKAPTVAPGVRVIDIDPETISH